MIRTLGAVCANLWLWSIAPLITGFLLVRWEILSPKLGLGLFGLGLLGWLLAGLLGLSLVVIQLATGHRPQALVLLAAIVPVILVVAYLRNSAGEGGRPPPIHDISTDTVNPPAFRAASALRPGWANSTDWAGDNHARIQRAAYPHLGGLLLPVPAESAYKAILELIGNRGWEITGREPASFRVEAVAETALWHFKDDVVIRVTAKGENHCLVDMRSASRVGVGDMGTNARRISDFLSDLDQRLGNESRRQE